MQGNKKAIVVSVELEIRIIIDDRLDPDVDHEELNEAVHTRISKRMKDEGPSFIGEGINDYNDDEENPYDYAYDGQFNYLKFK